MLADILGSDAVGILEIIGAVVSALLGYAGGRGHERHRAAHTRATIDRETRR